MAFYKKGLIFVLGVSVVAILLVTVILISIGNKQRDEAENEGKVKEQESKPEKAQIEKPPVSPTPETPSTTTSPTPSKESHHPMPGYLSVAGFQKCVGVKRNSVADSNGKSYTFETLCLPLVEIPDGCDPQTYVALKNLEDKDRLEDCTD